MYPTSPWTPGISPVVIVAMEDAVVLGKTAPIVEEDPSNEDSVRACPERAARADGIGLTLDPRETRRPDRDPEQVWLHPPALGGMMLGLWR